MLQEGTTQNYPRQIYEKRCMKTLVGTVEFWTRQSCRRTHTPQWSLISKLKACAAVETNIVFFPDKGIVYSGLWTPRFQTNVLLPCSGWKYTHKTACVLIQKFIHVWLHLTSVRPNSFSLLETNQQDAPSVCIYSTISVQMYMFRKTISFNISSS